MSFKKEKNKVLCENKKRGRGLNEQLQLQPLLAPAAASTWKTRTYLQMYIVFPDLGSIKEFIQLVVLAQYLTKNSANVLLFRARQACWLLPSTSASSRLICPLKFCGSGTKLKKNRH